MTTVERNAFNDLFAALNRFNNTMNALEYKDSIEPMHAIYDNAKQLYDLVRTPDCAHASKYVIVPKVVIMPLIDNILELSSKAIVDDNPPPMERE